MKTEDLTFIGDDPGAVKYGNFINYYSFHSTTQRVENLHTNMFPTLPQSSVEPIYCLDIGCNTGELTKELHGYMKTVYPNSNIYMLAIDIDPNLIKRAQESCSDPNITFKTINIMYDTDCSQIQQYLNCHKKNLFDVTFCFSVTMWIHLNNGDEGLLKFLHYLKAISSTLIVEPQPWHCYRNAQRRVKKSGSTFPLYETLKIRNNVDSVIENCLLENTHKKVYESPCSNWKRKIQSYQPKQIIETLYLPTNDDLKNK